MKTQKLLSLLLFTAMALGAAGVSNATDIFLQLEGMEGESRDKQFRNNIDVLNYTFGGSNSGTTHLSSSGGAGKPSFTDLKVTKFVDKTSPLLLYAMANGKLIKEAKLIVRVVGKDYPAIVYEMNLSDVMISSYEQGHSKGKDRMVDTFTLNFAKVKWKYWPVQPDGKIGHEVVRGWNIPLNTQF